MAQPVVTKIERLDDLCGQAAQGLVHALEIGFHRHFPMVTFRQDIRQPDHGRPPPTDSPLLPMAGDMPVQDFWEAHLDHLPNEQRHIVDPLRDNHHIALAKDLLGLFRELHSHGILLSHAAAPEKSIATACHGLKGPSIQSSRPLEIQLLDFLYGEWGDKRVAFLCSSWLPSLKECLSHTAVHSCCFACVLLLSFFSNTLIGSWLLESA